MEDYGRTLFQLPMAILAVLFLDIGARPVLFLLRRIAASRTHAGDRSELSGAGILHRHCSCRFG